MNTKLRVLKEQKKGAVYFRKRYKTNIKQIEAILRKENLPLGPECSYEQEMLYLILHSTGPNSTSNK